MHSSKAHDDVRADFFLDADRFFGREEFLVPVEFVVKKDPIFGDFAALGQRENLESAGIGQHRPVVLHEFMDAAGFRDDVFPGTKVKVVGIGQNDPGSASLDLLGGQGFDRGVRADRHEHRDFNVPMGRVQDAVTRPRRLIDVQDFQIKRFSHKRGYCRANARVLLGARKKKPLTNSEWPSAPWLC